MLTWKVGVVRGCMLVHGLNCSNCRFLIRITIRVDFLPHELKTLADFDYPAWVTCSHRLFPIFCGSYQDFVDIGLLLTRKLLNQAFLFIKLKSSLRRFYGHMPWLTAMCKEWSRICSSCRKHFPVISSFLTYHGFITRLTRLLLVG